MGRAKKWRVERLPKKLLEIRTNLNLTQDELVKELGLEGLIYRNNISEYESGKRQPPMPIVLAYAQLAKISTDVLIDDNLELNLPNFKVKKLLLNFCLFLLIGQVNAFSAINYRIDDIKPLALLNSSLNIKANFYFGDEDEKSLPIAETEFYLLDKSLVNILKDSKFQPEFLDGKQHKLEENDYLSATAKAFSFEDEESALIALLIKQEISKHKVVTVQTDYSGQANLKDLRMGNNIFSALEKLMMKFSFGILSLI